MKRFIVILATIAAFTALNSCEQHQWEDTKKLHVDKAKKDDTHHGQGDTKKSGADGEGSNKH